MRAAAETREEAYANAAGLLSRMGYDAFVREGWTPPGFSRPVTALVTCAPAVVVGMALGMTAEDPEAHLPERSAKVARPAPNKAGTRSGAGSDRPVLNAVGYLDTTSIGYPLA